MGGELLLPTSRAIRDLVAAELAADSAGSPTLIVARTDADAADMVISDADERDHEFRTGDRTVEGFFRSEAGIEQAIAGGVAYEPTPTSCRATSEPDVELAERFAKAIRDEHPVKLLAYNCSPTSAGKASSSRAIAGQRWRVVYRFQFITLAGFHTLNHSMFELARGYRAA